MCLQDVTADNLSLVIRWSETVGYTLNLKMNGSRQDGPILAGAEASTQLQENRLRALGAHWRVYMTEHAPIGPHAGAWPPLAEQGTEPSPPEPHAGA